MPSILQDYLTDFPQPRDSRESMPEPKSNGRDLKLLQRQIPPEEC